MDPEFLKGLKETFKIEATEQLQVIRSHLIAIEEAPDETARLLESLLRNFHSLKGSSRAVNLLPVEKTCQKVEHELIKVRESSSRLPHAFMDKLHEYVDALLHVINDFTTEGEKNYDFLLTIFDGFSVEAPDAAEVKDKMAVGASDDSQMSGLFVAPMIGPAGSTIRLPIDRLEGLVQTAEELVYAKLVSDQRYIDCNDLQLIVNQWTRRWQRLRPEIENEAQHRSMALLRGTTTVGASGSLQEFLDMHDSFVGRIQERLNSLEKSVVADRRTVEVLVDSLLEQSRELTMVPFLVMQNLLLKMVRDISKEQGKSIALSITGGEIEIDRHILDEMKDPLIHLIRNCIDHGIEPPDERVELGKYATAEINIRLSSARGGGNVEIVVTDDGRGIDPEKVKRSAIEKGILTVEKSGELSYQEALALIFRSSFSTRGTVSELSGRGLGCTIVKEKVEDLNGSVEVYSKIGLETTFRLSVPVRRQTMVGIAIRLGGRIFVVPTVSIRAAVRAKDQDVRMVEGKRTMIFNGRLVPMVSLSDLLHIEAQLSVDESTALVVGSGEYPIALLVDDVIGEQEVAVKPLPSPLTKIRNIGGATLLKTGDLAVVLNMNEILTSAVLVGTMKTDSIGLTVKPIAPPKPPRQKRILVVEDSITSRVLLKNILESAGYIVTVANDGQDGWEKQAGEKFDLIVTDVEMPRMNGFDLTKKVRNESTNKDVPIIVVTSLASLDDRRKGVDVGANAYFVKSNFEKTNLLDMVKRLI